MNKTTRALTTDQYEAIIAAIRHGGNGYRPNERVAMALVIEANLGIRISDVLRLRLCDIVKDGLRYRLQIVEIKTGKRRTFTVPENVRKYIQNYAAANGIADDEIIIPITERAVNKILHAACRGLGFEGIGTHSFRKWYATDLYQNNDHDIALVQTMLQHSSVSVTQRYIGIAPERVEAAIEKHVFLP